MSLCGWKASYKYLYTNDCEPSWPETKLRTKGTQEIVGCGPPVMCATWQENNCKHRSSNYKSNPKHSEGHFINPNFQ